MKKLFILLPLILLANVNISVNKKHINIGEELIITISAEGKNIQFPNINKIAEFNILATSLRNNITIINGKTKKNVSKSYIIMPDKNFTIPSFNIKIDGKIYKTKPIKIVVTTPKQTKGDFRLDINLSKKKAYLGESLIFSIKYTEKKPASTVNIQKPKIPGAIVKILNKKEIKNGIIYNFLVIPQKAGHFKIGPLIANIGEEVTENLLNDPFFPIKQIKYKTIFSNQLTLDIYPIPKNTTYGNFTISLKASTKAKTNKPNTATLTIMGCGDFYDLPEFHLNIKNATVYEATPKIRTFIQNNKLCGKFTKEFHIIAESNYTIPKITLNEFNGTINTISTHPIKVEVKDIATKTPKPTKIVQSTIKTHSNLLPYIIIILTIGIGTIFIFLYFKSDNLIKKIKKANEKELFNLLLAYESHPKIKEILIKLDENIYQNKTHKINKKEIIKIIKNLKD